jgi:hypothetical protein
MSMTHHTQTKVLTTWFHRQDFHTYYELFIVGLNEIIMHVWNLRTVYIFSNIVVKESNKFYHLNLISNLTIRNTT